MARIMAVKRTRRRSSGTRHAFASQENISASSGHVAAFLPAKSEPGKDAGSAHIEEIWVRLNAMKKGLPGGRLVIATEAQPRRPLHVVCRTGSQPQANRLSRAHRR